LKTAKQPETPNSLTVAQDVKRFKMCHKLRPNCATS